MEDNVHRLDVEAVVGADSPEELLPVGPGGEVVHPGARPLDGLVQALVTALYPLVRGPGEQTFRIQS